MTMRIHVAWLIALVAVVLGTTVDRAQVPGYPITLIPHGKGPYTFPAGYQTSWDRTEIRVAEKISPNLFVLRGSEGISPNHPDASGARAMVLFGPDGVLMVDAQNEQVAQKTLAALRTFTDAPIKIVVNTHVHEDHGSGSAFFVKQGALLFGQENLRNELLRPVGRRGRQPAPPDMARVPVATYPYDPTRPGEPGVTFNINGETVDLIPMPPSHTAGDTIVRFRNANAIYVEDVYQTSGGPFADHNNGGSLNGMIEAIDIIGRLAAPDTTLIPGHGPLIKKADLLPYRTMLVDIMATVAVLKNQGKSLQEVLAANLAAPYDAITEVKALQSKNRFITEAYDEVRDFPPVVDGKRTMPTR